MPARSSSSTDGGGGGGEEAVQVAAAAAATSSALSEVRMLVSDVAGSCNALQSQLQLVMELIREQAAAVQQQQQLQQQQWEAAAVVPSRQEQSGQAAAEVASVIAESTQEVLGQLQVLGAELTSEVSGLRSAMMEQWMGVQGGMEAAVAAAAGEAAATAIEKAWERKAQAQQQREGQEQGGEFNDAGGGGGGGGEARGEGWGSKTGFQGQVEFDRWFQGDEGEQQQQREEEGHGRGPYQQGLQGGLSTSDSNITGERNRGGGFGEGGVRWPAQQSVVRGGWGAYSDPAMYPEDASGGGNGLMMQSGPGRGAGEGGALPDQGGDVAGDEQQQQQYREAQWGMDSRGMVEGGGGQQQGDIGNNGPGGWGSSAPAAADGASLVPAAAGSVRFESPPLQQAAAAVGSEAPPVTAVAAGGGRGPSPRDPSFSPSGSLAPASPPAAAAMYDTQPPPPTQGLPPPPPAAAAAAPVSPAVAAAIREVAGVLQLPSEVLVPRGLQLLKAGREATRGSGGAAADLGLAEVLLAGAVAVFQRAVEEAPGDSRARGNLGNALLASGELKRVQWEGALAGGAGEAEGLR